MSKTRWSSLLSASASVNCGERQSMTWRVGASRLPSRRGAGVSLTALDLDRLCPDEPVRAERVTKVGERVLLAERVQSLLETVRVRALGLGERLEPVRDLLETLAAGGLRHARIHVGVLVGLAGDRGLQIVAGLADGQAGGGVADRLEILEVTVRVARLALGRRPEHGRDVVIALDVGLGGEVEVAAIRLRLAGEGVLQILLGLAALEVHCCSPAGSSMPAPRPAKTPLDFV